MLHHGRNYHQQAEEGVFLGYAESDAGQVQEPVWFTGEGGLVTIAPPGAGKGQSQIIPNLLTYDGPAIVLDIKRENYDLTHKWRQENVGR